MFRNFSVKQWLFLLLAITAVVGGTLLSQRGNTPKVIAREPDIATQPGGRDSVRVEAVHPTAGNIERQTIQPGSVIAYESADLFAKVSGYLKTQAVDIGSRVKEGDVLCEIYAPELVKKVQEDQATVDQAKAQVMQARAHIVSAEADRDAAEAAVQQCKRKWGGRPRSALSGKNNTPASRASMT